MPALIPYQITILYGTVLLASVCFYLSALIRNRFLCIWGFGLIAYSFIGLFDLLTILEQESPILIIANQVIFLLSSLLILWGVCVFLERSMSICWGGFAFLVFIYFMISKWAGYSPLVYTLPVFAFTGAAYIWSGMMFLLALELKGVGKYITGGLFILCGINNGFTFYCRFIDQTTWSHSWGLFITEIFLLLCALVILLVYFKKSIPEEYSEKSLELMTESVQDVSCNDRRFSGGNILKEVQKKADRTDKMVFLGTMTASMLHEINQPLNALRLAVDGTLYWHNRGRVYEQEEIIGELEGVSRQVNRIDQIIKRIHSFIKSDNSYEIFSCNLNVAVERSLEKIKGQFLARGISVKKSLEKNLPAVLGDGVRIEEIIVNLSMNAMQSLESLKKDDKEIILRTFTMDRNIVLEVVDNGQGVKEEDRDRIFEPFFTTRDQFGGTGLGLSIVDSIVRSLNGQISVANNHKGGATFKIIFPSIDDKDETVPGGENCGHTAC